jgi:hypothetical protein
LSPIRRALFTNGRLAVCVDPLPTPQNRVARVLTLYGFTAIQANRTAGRQAIGAKAPALATPFRDTCVDRRPCPACLSGKLTVAPPR